MRIWLVALLMAAAHPALAEVKPLPVPKVTLYPGDVITSATIGFKDFHVTGDTARRFVIDPAQVEGKTAGRTLMAGKPIALAHLAGVKVVRKGALAHALLRRGALAIDLMVEPLEDGAAGQMIRARNNESGTEIRLLVQADGTLEAAP